MGRRQAARSRHPRERTPRSPRHFSTGRLVFSSVCVPAANSSGSGALGMHRLLRQCMHVWHPARLADWCMALGSAAIAHDRPTHNGAGDEHDRCAEARRKGAGCWRRHYLCAGTPSHVVPFRPKRDLIGSGYRCAASLATHLAPRASRPVVVHCLTHVFMHV